MVQVIKTKHRRPRRREEAGLQVLVMQGLEVMLPKGAFAFHCPNGGSRNVIEAANLKRQGVKAGVPDIIIIYQGKSYGLELKSATGTLSDSQKITFPLLREAGMRIEVAQTFEEAVHFIKEMGVPLRSIENKTKAVQGIFNNARARAA